MLKLSVIWASFSCFVHLSSFFSPFLPITFFSFFLSLFVALYLSSFFLLTPFLLVPNIFYYISLFSSPSLPSPPLLSLPSPIPQFVVRWQLTFIFLHGSHVSLSSLVAVLVLFSSQFFFFFLLYIFFLLTIVTCHRLLLGPFIFIFIFFTICSFESILSLLFILRCSSYHILFPLPYFYFCILPVFFFFSSSFYFHPL